MTTTKDNRPSTNDDDSSRVTAANSTSNNSNEGENDHAAPVVSQQQQHQPTTTLRPQDQEKKQKASTFNNDASSVTTTSEKKKPAYAGVPVSPSSDHQHQHVSKQLDAENIMIPQPDQIRQSPQEEGNSRENNNNEEDDNQESSSSSNGRRNDNDRNRSVPGAYRVTPGSSGGVRTNSSQYEITAADIEHYEAGFPGQVFFVPGESLLRPSLPRQQHQQQQQEEEQTPQDDFGDTSSLPVANSVNGDDGVDTGNTTSEYEVLDELDRLGVPTVRNAVVIQEVQEQAPSENDNNNASNDEDEENNIIPSAVVTNYAHHADPISTTSIFCLPKEINRGTVKWISYIVLLGIVALISSIVAIVAYQRGGSTATIDGSTTTTLLSQEEQDEIIANRNYIQELISPLSNQEDLQDPTSPQSKAFNWLINPETNINFYTRTHQDGFDWDSRIIERYVMAVLYYSTDGDNWTRNDWTGKILSLRGRTSPICSWKILQCSPMTLDDGLEELSSLDTSKFTQTWAGRVVGINLGKCLFLPYFLLLPFLYNRLCN